MRPIASSRPALVPSVLAVLLPALTVLVAADALAAPAGAAPASFFELSARGIDGKERAFAEYKGKVVLVVNVASRCGYTKQYEGLQRLYAAYEPKGLVILGFPSNEFMWQEPGTDGEIATFCKLKYGVTFPMFSKVQVKGASASPVYRFLASAGEPGWNFHKYLVGKDGRVIRAFESKVEPDEKALTDAIDAALAK